MTMFPAVERHGLSHDESGEDPVPGTVPVGGIIMWSGAVATIPGGWALCDGTNDTPDLRGKFVIGAGGAYNPDDSGGNAAFTHSSGGSHTHNSQGGHAHDNIGSHGHSLQAGAAVALGTDFSVATDAAGTHQHNTQGAHTHDTLGGHTHDQHPLPPYYALAFIMRLY